MSTKLYGLDEGYATVITRTNLKKVKFEEKKIRKQMADQESVMKGPPFNPVVDLSKLSHEEFVIRASQVSLEFGRTPTNDAESD